MLGEGELLYGQETLAMQLAQLGQRRHKVYSTSGGSRDRSSRWRRHLGGKLRPWDLLLEGLLLGHLVLNRPVLLALCDRSGDRGCGTRDHGGACDCAQ